MNVSSLRCSFALTSKCFRLPLFQHNTTFITSQQGLGLIHLRGISSATNLHRSLLCINNSYRNVEPSAVTFCYCVQPALSHSFMTSRFSAYSSKCENNEPEKKPSLLQRFKEMYRDYWYVLVPVHAITSLMWFGGFYYSLKSGVDVVNMLEYLEISEKILNPLRDSSAGYLAISYAMYKIFTPLRYTVTLGGTTISINYLKKWGYIRPIPPREKLKEMYEERRDNLKERKASIMESMRGTKNKGNTTESGHNTHKDMKMEKMMKEKLEKEATQKDK